MTASTVKIVRCAGGQEPRGTDEELIPVVQLHGAALHNMDATVRPLPDLQIPDFLRAAGFTVTAYPAGRRVRVADYDALRYFGLSFVGVTGGGWWSGRRSVWCRCVGGSTC